MEFKDFLGGVIGDSKQVSDKEVRFCCPFCGEVDYKFYVKVADDSSDGQYHCKKCNVKGNPITFMKDFYDLSSNREAYDVLTSNGIEMDTSGINKFNNNKELTESEKLMLIINGYEPMESKDTTKLTPPKLPTNLKYLRNEKHRKDAQPYLYYLYSRGVSDEQIDKHCIGYVIDGWFKTSGDKYVNLKHSIVFFTFDDNGNYIYWNTRSIEPNTKLKTINAPGKDHEYTRKEVVFNLNVAKNLPFIVINEGVFDALTFGDYGVATFGKQVTDSQIELILNSISQDTLIFLFLDSDATDVTQQVASSLYRKHKRTYLVPHGDKDANDMGTSESFKLLKKNAMLATPENVTTFVLKEKLKI